MKTHPRTLVKIFAASIVLVAGTALAQQAGRGGNGQPAAGGQQNSMQLQLFYELNLDETQAAEVQAIMEAARLMHAEEWALFQANREAIRAGAQTAIMGVLDEVQQARFLELQVLRSEQWAEGRGGRGGSGGPNGSGSGNGPGTGECPNPDGPNEDCPFADPPDGDG